MGAPRESKRCTKQGSGERRWRKCGVGVRAAHRRSSADHSSRLPHSPFGLDATAVLHYRSARCFGAAIPATSGNPLHHCVERWSSAPNRRHRPGKRSSLSMQEVHFAVGRTSQDRRSHVKNSRERPAFGSRSDSSWSFRPAGHRQDSSRRTQSHHPSVALLRRTP